MSQSETYDSLYDTIAELVMCHSPSGAEYEINEYLLDRLSASGIEHWQDEADNVVARIAGTGAGAIAITAHKDEIGGIVKEVEPNGRVLVRKLGGAFPWVYGEGVVDFLGDHETVSGILSFGSRHVSHESIQKLQQEGDAVTWEAAWVETKRSLVDLEAAGVRPGTRMVVGKHRKQPYRLGDYIASYTLDNKASVAILLTLAQELNTPSKTVYLVFSAKEEVGAIGALYFSNRQKLEALVALEICPLSEEYPIASGEAPVLLSQDKYGLYDESLNQQLLQAAQSRQCPVQQAIITGFGSDASIAMTFGHVPKAACLSFPTHNTHGYEIAHLGAIAHCIDILTQYCNDL